LIFVFVFMFWQNAGTDEDGLKISVQLSDVIWLIVLAFVMGTISALTAGAAARRSIKTLARN